MKSGSRAIVPLFLVLVALPYVVNGQDSEVLSLDAHIPFPGVRGRIDHFSVDVKNQRLFVAAVENHTLDQTGERIAAGEIAGETDDLLYDSVRHRVYVLTSAGYLEVFEQKDADHYNRIARYPTPSRSQTGLFVQEWGKLSVAAPAENNQSAEIRLSQAH